MFYYNCVIERSLFTENKLVYTMFFKKKTVEDTNITSCFLPFLAYHLTKKMKMTGIKDGIMKTLAATHIIY